MARKSFESTVERPFRNTKLLQAFQPCCRRKHDWGIEPVDIAVLVQSQGDLRSVHGSRRVSTEA